MSHLDLAALVSEAIDAECSDTDRPFEERAVSLRVLQHPEVAGQRGSAEYEDIETRVRTEVPTQLRSRIDEMGQRSYLAGRGPNGRHVWYPMRLVKARANGNDALLRKLVAALQRQDAEYATRTVGHEENR